MNLIKVLFVITLSLSFFFTKVRAQDTIALKTGKTLIVPIDEVGEDYILYVKVDDKGKPESKSISIKDVRRINYKNGYIDVFSNKDTDERDRIELINGKIIKYKIVELGENTVLVDAGRKDSTILLNEIASITYTNGFTQKYNGTKDRPIAEDQKNVKNETVIAAAAPVNTSKVAGNDPVQSQAIVQSSPEKPQLAKANEKTKQGVANDIQTVNTSDKLTLGIGYVVDSVTNISTQFYLYDFLVHNPIITSDKKTIIPVLTFRNGLCDYYLYGNIRNPQSKFYLLQKGEVKASIVIPTTGTIVYTDLIKTLYTKIYSVLANQNGNGKSIKLSLPEIPVADFASTKPIRHNLLLNATNYTPPLDDYLSISKAYLKPMADIDSVSLSRLLSYSFTKLSQRAKYKDAAYVRYSSVLEEYAKVLPEYPETPIKADREPMPFYIINGNLKLKKTNDEAIKYLECVFPTYTSNKLKGFFFESSFVDDKAKTAAKQAILPLYKRPGTVLTYMQCGKDFAKVGATDAAIESFSSGLLIVNNLNTSFTFKEFLKASLFEELAKAYEQNKQLSSATICKNLSDFHKKLYNSHIYDSDNQTMKENTQNLTSYFEKVESDALEARSKKRSAFFTGLASVALSVASASVDASSGLSTLSDQTVAFVGNATANFDQAAAIKKASIANSEVAAEQFNESFGQMIDQMHFNSEASSDWPVFTMDFVELLSDKAALDVLSDNIKGFLQQVPYLQSMVNEYLSASNATNKKPVTLNDIYAKFGKLEMDIITSESYGVATTQKDLLDYH